jgi:L-2-hydroxyglutarate oxidase LhgO
MMDEIAAVVIGAGVVGLAVARALAARGTETVILEAAHTFGTGVSARNSEVIHAGIYYPAGSLKARLCVSGRDALYAYCQERDIPHRRCGKLIVATDAAQLPRLAELAGVARANGVEVEALDQAATLALEPALQAVGALYSPLTGIIDAHSLMQALLADAQAHGAVLAARSAVTRLVPQARGLAIAVNGGEPLLRARAVINCAGIQAPALARLIDGFPRAQVPAVHYLKGSYFVLRGRAPFSRLIYPLPEAHALGIHLTLDLAGRARFGPDLEWVEGEDYAVDPQRARAFYGAVRRYWPGLPEDALEPGYAGIRPKITGPAEPAADFRIEGPSAHGIAGLVNLFGIESPGLTACLAIAAEALTRLG